MALIAVFILLKDEFKPPITLISDALRLAFLTEIKMSQIVLSKMVASVRVSNPYSQKLDAIIELAGLEPINEATEDEDLRKFLTKQCSQ